MQARRGMSYADHQREGLGGEGDPPENFIATKDTKQEVNTVTGDQKMAYAELETAYNTLKAENDAIIIEEYMGFCRIWDEHVLKARTLEEKRQAVLTTIALCIEKGYLVKYLEEHRAEAEKVMMTMRDPDYIRRLSERTERIKGDISFARYINMPEAEIKDVIIKRYNLTPAYAQNFLDDDSDPNDSRPWAV